MYAEADQGKVIRIRNSAPFPGVHETAGVDETWSRDIGRGYFLLIEHTICGLCQVAWPLIIGAAVTAFNEAEID